MTKHSGVFSVHSVYLTSRCCSVNGNVATFREVSEIRGGDFARLYLENGKSYEKSHSRGCEHPGPSALRSEAQIRHRLGQGWSERFLGLITPFKNIWNSVPEVFMTTPIHVLCSHFTEIVRREVGERIRCFGDKKVLKMRFSVPFCVHSTESAKSLRGRVTTRDPTSLCKISSHRFRFAGVIPEKVISNSYKYSICLWHIKRITYEYEMCTKTHNNLLWRRQPTC